MQFRQFYPNILIIIAPKQINYNWNILKQTMLFLCEKTIFSLYLYKSYFKDIFIPNCLKTTSLEIFRCVKISVHKVIY